MGSPAGTWLGVGWMRACVAGAVTGALAAALSCRIAVVEQPVDKAYVTYLCTDCRDVFRCKQPIMRVVKCPLCGGEKAYPAWQCNNSGCRGRTGDKPTIFPYVLSKEVFPWLRDDESWIRLVNRGGAWKLRDKVLAEYPKCPKCGWRPGRGYAEGAKTWGVEQHYAADAPIFECESLDGPDDYPGPTPAEIVRYLEKHGRLPEDLNEIPHMPRSRKRPKGAGEGSEGAASDTAAPDAPKGEAPPDAPTAGETPDAGEHEAPP